MKTKLILIAITIISAIACNTNKQQCKAKITERKVLNDSLIQISYAYKVSDKIFEDSLQTKNIIINSDSITILFSSKNPKEHTTQMP
ncbi:MAG: hypothetical protein KF781_09820 [Chitinophagaceae bacterium]|nr:hypothetical protein [Chitinophagaceae bacterium]MCW5904550.1 hypothetical protein [Chitinophagaceae bacterium]